MFTTTIKSDINEDISILVQLDNHPWNYLCECGDARNLSVKEIQNCNAIFISHTHIDHFANFDAVIRHQIGIQRRVVICGPEHIAKQIKARIKSYTWNLIERGAIIYEIREVISENKIIIYEIAPPIWELKQIQIIDSNTVFRHENFAVTATLLDHKTPTLAYKFQEKDTIKIDIQSSGFKGGIWVKELKDCYTQKEDNSIITIENNEYKAKDLFHLLHIKAGDSLGIIMDHAAHKKNHLKIKELFWGCKKVFIECFYRNEDKELAQLNFHSYAQASGEIMKKTNVKEAIPVHFSRKYSKEDIPEIFSEFENAFNKVTF